LEINVDHAIGESHTGLLTAALVVASILAHPDGGS
jgi:hypothetical protein